MKRNVAVGIAFVFSCLLPSAFAAGVSILNTNGEQSCPPGVSPCKILVKASLLSAPTACRVEVDSGNIMNPARKRGVDKPVKLQWEIVLVDSADQTQYEFTNRGIELLGGKNDEDYDLDNGGWPMSGGVADKRKFKWRNLNARFIRLTYNVNVQYKTSTMSSFAPCDPVDPVIINKGD